MYIHVWWLKESSGKRTQVNKRNFLQLLINYAFPPALCCFTLTASLEQSTWYGTVSTDCCQPSEIAVFLKSPCFLRPLEENLPEGLSLVSSSVSDVTQRGWPPVSTAALLGTLHLRWQPGAHARPRVNTCGLGSRLLWGARAASHDIHKDEELWV